MKRGPGRITKQNKEAKAWHKKEKKKKIETRLNWKEKQPIQSGA